jgi:hypothetical protein
MGLGWMGWDGVAWHLWAVTLNGPVHRKRDSLTSDNVQSAILAISVYMYLYDTYVEIVVCAVKFQRWKFHEISAPLLSGFQNFTH